MKVTATPDISNVETIDDVKRFSTACLKQLVESVNGNLILTENVKASVVSVSFGSADSDTAVAHNLGKPPVGFILCGASVAMSLYNGSTAANNTTIFIKSTAAGSASVLVF